MARPWRGTGDLTWRRLDWVRPEQVHLAPEDRVCVTMLEMLNVEGIVLEPAGALSVNILPEIAAQIRARRWSASPRAATSILSGCRK